MVTGVQTCALPISNVVVTNPTNTKRLVQVLTQIPAGALPLASGKVTRNTPIDLARTTSSVSTSDELRRIIELLE